MPRYLVKASYTVEGTKGLLKEGGTGRRKAVQQAVEGLGGKLEAFYYAFGETDVYGIAEMPDNVSAAAFSLLVAASGAARVTGVVLITPEEIDQATKKATTYRPPGA
ncbi:MAG: GYD domain-containing protein [Deltaproteobacteria bacterium]|nr:GYD domain-containing protein [Deltaproteobacteria bacterium]